MAKRQRTWARKTRDKLILLLGGKCVKCGTTIQLEFDVIIPTGNFDKNGKEKHHSMEWSWRMSFYRQQHANNNLQLLCEKHNIQKSNQLELRPKPIEEPF